MLLTCVVSFLVVAKVMYFNYGNCIFIFIVILRLQILVSYRFCNLLNGLLLPCSFTILTSTVWLWQKP